MITWFQILLSVKFIEHCQRNNYALCSKVKQKKMEFISINVNCSKEIVAPFYSSNQKHSSISIPLQLQFHSISAQLNSHCDGIVTIYPLLPPETQWITAVPHDPQLAVVLMNNKANNLLASQPPNQKPKNQRPPEAKPNPKARRNEKRWRHAVRKRWPK